MIHPPVHIAKTSFGEVIELARDEDVSFVLILGVSG